MNNQLIYRHSASYKKFDDIEELLIRWGTIKRELIGISEVNKILATEYDSYLLKKANYITFDDFRTIESYINALNDLEKDFFINRYIKCYKYDSLEHKVHCSVRHMFNIRMKHLKILKEILRSDKNDKLYNESK